MAGLPLNTFKNVPFAVTQGTPVGTPVTVYSAPLGITSIVLMAQVSNITTSEATVSFLHYSHRLGVTTYIVKDIAVPPSDARILLGGKLVMESLDQIKIIGSTNNAMQFLASVLETANQ